MYILLLLLLLILLYYIFFIKESFTGFRRYGGLTEWRTNYNLFPFIFLDKKI